MRGYGDYTHSEKDPDGTVESTFNDKEWDTRAEVGVRARSGRSAPRALGVQLQHRDVLRRSARRPIICCRRARRRSAVFLFTEAPLSDRLHLQAGARVEACQVAGTSPVTDLHVAPGFTPVSGSVGVLFDAIRRGEARAHGFERRARTGADRVVRTRPARRTGHVRNRRSRPYHRARQFGGRAVCVSRPTRCASKVRCGSPVPQLHLRPAYRAAPATTTATACSDDTRGTARSCSTTSRTRVSGAPRARPTCRSATPRRAMLDAQLHRRLRAGDLRQRRQRAAHSAVSRWRRIVVDQRRLGCGVPVRLRGRAATIVGVADSPTKSFVESGCAGRGAAVHRHIRASSLR